MKKGNRYLDTIFGILIIGLIICILISISDHQKAFFQAQGFAYDIIKKIDGRPFKDIKNGEDVNQIMRVHQSLEYPTDKQVQIGRKHDIVSSQIIFYVENQEGLAKVVDVKYNGVHFLSDYETYMGEINETHFDLTHLINRINNENFNVLEDTFNTEYSGAGYDFEYHITVYQSIDYPCDKQIEVTQNGLRNKAILYVENHNGIAKVVDVKEK